MASNILFSVLIPVYNAQSTITRCLDSLLPQMSEDTEIILVDDGSTDKSAEICELYIQKYTGIYLYRKKNGGVSSARNYALNHARGQYILFVDSDDFVYEEYFSVIRSYINEYPDLDSLVFSLAIQGKRNFRDILQKQYLKGRMQAALGYEKIYHMGLANTLMIRVFKRDILEKYHIRFNEQLSISEDSVFIFQYSLHIEEMATSEKCLYCLREESDDSLSRKARPYLQKNLLAAHIDKEKSLNETDTEDAVGKLYQKTLVKSFYRSAYSCCNELKKYDLTSGRRRREIRKICSAYRRMHVVPTDLKTFLTALPICLKAAWMIDFMIHAKKRKG